VFGVCTTLGGKDEAGEEYGGTLMKVFGVENPMLFVGEGVMSSFVEFAGETSDA
jgi:hypothetical protein